MLLACALPGINHEVNQKALKYGLDGTHDFNSFLRNFPAVFWQIVAANAVQKKNVECRKCFKPFIPLSSHRLTPSKSKPLFTDPRLVGMGFPAGAGICGPHLRILSVLLSCAVPFGPSPFCLGPEISLNSVLWPLHYGDGTQLPEVLCVPPQEMLDKASTAITSQGFSSMLFFLPRSSL